MRITRDLLVRLANENVQQRTYKNPEIAAAYLTGSLLTDDPFLGNSTDIDLVFIHQQTAPLRREIVRLTDDIHLDIIHRTRREYEPARELRTAPHLGFEIYDPVLLYENNHFFEFIQASVRAGFHDPSNQLQRSTTLLNQARSAWMQLQLSSQPGVIELHAYLQAVLNAANAIAVLNGAPLTDRRFMQSFTERANAIERPDLIAIVVDLLGGQGLTTAAISKWLPDWKNSIAAANASHHCDPTIYKDRLAYYKKGIETHLSNGQPVHALWMILHTWVTAMKTVEDATLLAKWQQTFEQPGLLGDAFEERMANLDHFIDEIDIHLENMAASNGLDYPHIGSV